MTLDIAAVVIEPLVHLMTSKNDIYVATGLGAVKLILSKFGQLIKDTIAFVSPASGVDLSREVRFEKCLHCGNCLIQIGEEIQRLKDEGRKQKEVERL